MRTFDHYIKALGFSEKNVNTLVRCVRKYSDGAGILCYLYNGQCHGVYICYNNDGTVSYRDFCINEEDVDVYGLTEIQLENIFGESYERI